MKRQFYLMASICCIGTLVSTSAMAGSKCLYGTTSSYSYNDFGTHIAVIWSSGDINGTRCVEWTGDVSTFEYEWSLSSGGSIGRVIKDNNSPGFDSKRVDDCGNMDVSKTVSITDNGGGDWNNMIYGWWGTSPTNFASVEWYVIDSQDTWWFSGYENLGTVNTNGSNYTCYRKDYRSSRGFWQYVALRSNQRSSGTVRLKTIFNFWRSKGAPNDYVGEISVGCENFNGGGGRWYASSVTIPNCGSGSGGGGGGGGGGGITNNATYRLKCAWGNKYLNATGNSNGANVTNKNLNTSWSSQKWKFENTSGSTYRLRCEWGGKYLNGNNTNGGNVNVANLNTGWSSQRWTAENVSGSQYRLKCNWGNKYLNAEGNGDNANVGVANLNTSWGSQKWTLENASGSREADEALTTQDAELSVYPNPTSDILNISGLDKYHIELYDIEGRLMLTKHDVSGVEALNIAHLNKGTYILKLVQADQTISKKIVLN